LLSIDQEAVIVAFRKHTLLPLDLGTAISSQTCRRERRSG
jgi:hypothetical protein